MSRRAFFVPLTGVLFVACASVPVPATRSPENPAHPAAPEAVTPAASPSLVGEAQDPESPALAPQPLSHEGHSTDGAPGSPAPEAAVYTCPMHPEVRSGKPGACPVCGMSLVPAEKPKGDSR